MTNCIGLDHDFRSGETQMRLLTTLFFALSIATSPASALSVETVVQGLEHPWGLAFLPDGSMLVSERPGRLRIVSNGKLLPPIANVPRVAARGQGGLLDIALHPDFANNRLMYLSFAEPRGLASNGTSLARARLSDDNTALENVEVIFQQKPAIVSTAHFGGRIVFAPDGNLFLTLGDRYSQRDSAQNLSTHLGKTVRLTDAGKPARGNPFLETKDALPEIWSYGHRNAQGAAIEPTTGAYWTVEHGAQGGDEVNRPEGGKNYGWPVITYGKDYSGAKIGVGTSQDGMEQPLHFWDPSIAPSGLAFYQGSDFPQWNGDLLVGALAGMKLVRLDIEGGKVVGEEALLENLGERIRDVRVTIDGQIFLLTDSPDGAILRVRE
jgi:aldose sugar dehydrogenase